MAVLVEVARQGHYIQLQLSSEQTSKPDVRHQHPSRTNQRHGVRLGSLVTLAHCLGNARVLTFSMRAAKVACSLA